MTLTTLAASISAVPGGDSAVDGAAMGLIAVILILAVIVGFLVGGLFIRIAAGAVVKHKPSWKRAFGVLLIMAVAAGLIHGIFDDHNEDTTTGPELLGTLLSYLASSAIVAALLMHADGRRIGFAKGLLVMLLVYACYIGIFIGIFVVGMLIGLSIPLLSGS